MTVIMTRMVNRRMRSVGMMSLTSLLVTALSSLSSTAGCFSLTAVAGAWSVARTCRRPLLGNSCTYRQSSPLWHNCWHSDVSACQVLWWQCASREVLGLGSNKEKLRVVQMRRNRRSRRTPISLTGRTVHHTSSDIGSNTQWQAAAHNIHIDTGCCLPIVL